MARRKVTPEGESSQAPAQLSKQAVKSKKVASLTMRTMPLASLHEHPKNPRIHHPEGTPEWEALKKSVEHDYFDPLIWNGRNGMLVSGHYRKKVLDALGYTHVSVIVVDYDDATHEARMLAANHLNGTDNISMRKKLFEELLSLGDFELSLTGFSLPEMERLGVIKEPDFEGDGSGEEDEEDGEGGLEDSDSSLDSQERSIKYFQLIYESKEYEEFASLLGRFRDRYAKELVRDFGDDGRNDLASNMLYALRKLCK